MTRIALLLAAALGSLAVGCEKTETTSPGQSTGPEAEDALDSAATLLVRTLLTADHDELKQHTADPLTHDLSKAEFADLASVVGWLGPLVNRSETKTDMSHGGGQRWYQLQFEKGAAVDLEISLDASGKLIGFQFGGDGYTEAERGVLAEPFREFKVYDFVYLGADDQPIPADAPIAGNRVEYEVVVGGIEAFVGQHHLKVRKTLFDSSGKEVFVEPVEFDTKFGADAMGVPRGVVRGHLEVPGPGTWELLLHITDENSHRTVDSRHSFATTAGG